MKIRPIILLNLVFHCIFSNIFSQTVIYDEELSGTWTKTNSPYVVLRNITVPEDSVLIIEPGVEVQFATNTGLSVMGNLLAFGTGNDKIIFTSVDPDEVENDNTLGWKGIAIHGESSDTSILENCIVEYVYNYGDQFYAAINVTNRHAVINKCTIRKNTGYTAGAIYCRDEADVKIINSFIENNSVRWNRPEGGIYVTRSNALIMNNLISNNETGITIGSRNANSDTVKIYNNTIVQDTPFTYSFNRYMVVNNSGLVKMQNCILWNSYETDMNMYEAYNSEYSLLTDCIIKHGKSGVRIENSHVEYHNLYDGNPHFVDFQNGNFQITDSSYCINAGTPPNPALLSLMPNDFSGNPRVFDNGIIDIGAYEFQGDMITNRPPSISNPGTQNIFISTHKEMVFSFSDVDENDTHTLSVQTDNPNISVGALSGQSNNATYTITPDEGWSGMAQIILSVYDNHGAGDIDTFMLVVGDTVDYDITENTTWSKDTVYIGGHFTVTANATLEIEAGTCILFMDNYHTTVNGTIVANGTPAGKITFIPADTTGFSSDSHIGWGGFTFRNKQTTSVFNHCIFEYVKNRCVFDMEENTGADIISCIFRYNSALADYRFASVISLTKSSLFVGNSIFHDNWSRYNTFDSYMSDITLCHNVFFNNSASRRCLNASGDAQILNSIFWSNRSNLEINVSSSSTADISNCIVEGGVSAISTNQSLNKDLIHNVYPVFNDSIARDFHLLPASPGINTGINHACLATLDNSDIEGNSRIYSGLISIPDIGAYEFQGEPSNRPPVLEKTEDKTAMLGNQVNGIVNFLDVDETDTHTITILSDHPGVEIRNLSGDTTGSVYTMVPSEGFEGDVAISVMVEDDGGLRDSMSYNLRVTQSACGSIFNDITWDDDTIHVVCDVIVEEEAKLTIAPGVKVIFHGPYMLNVYGSLIAEGAENDTIRFILSDTITFNETEFANAWRGIKLNSAEGQETSVLNYCEIRNSKDRGLELRSRSQTIVTNCNIHHNRTENYASGAGIYMDSSFDGSIIENNNIHHNVSARSAGGIYVGSHHSRILGNTISNNIASFGDGGGIATSSYAPVTIEGNIIENNHAVKGYGGGIYSSKGDTIMNNIIRNNSSRYGGGIRGYEHCVIINNTIEGNYCIEEEYSMGGGIFLNVGEFEIINNLIINNYAGAGGGGIYLRTVSGLFANNTVYGNTSDSPGSAIYLSGEKAPVLVNNILWGNKSPASESLIHINDETAQPNISYSFVEGGIDNISCSENTYYNDYLNNMDVYPCFTDTANNDFSLADSSICINAGSIDTAGLNIPASDIAGNARIYDGDIKRIDIGAYEYAGEPVNRRPVLNGTDDIHLFTSQTKQMTVKYHDTDHGDTHMVTIESDEANLTIENQSGNASGSTYDLVAAADWVGSAMVKLKVQDSQGLTDSSYYQVIVSDSICGEITQNTSWDTDTVFISCDITIPAGSTLTIMPGTDVIFKGNYEIHVYGTLVAEGTDEDRIVFMPADTLITSSSGYWKGIYIHSFSSNADTSKLSYCDIHNANVKIVRDKVTVSNCLFNNCSYINGGGICVFNASPLIENSIFTNNKVTNTGGAIACIDQDYFDDLYTRPVIRGNEFFNNSATHGGALYLNGADATISDNIFHHNRASNGGAIYIFEEGNSILRNNLIYKNTATNNGGAIGYHGSRRIYQLNNTIVKNKAGKGGALYMQYYSSPQIYNDILFYNEANQSGQQVYLANTTSGSGFSNCLIQYGLDSIAGPGADPVYTGMFENILAAEPHFADTSNNNYQLTDSSFCINAGTMNIPGTGFYIPRYDISGNDRIFEGTVSIIDAGAYEFQGNPANRRPIIEPAGDQYAFINETKKLSVYFRDIDRTDTHTISITTDNEHVSIENLSGNISGSTYELIPDDGWHGVAGIFVRVEDDGGKYAIDTFSLILSEYFCGSITENTTWDKDTVRVSCDVTIEKDATLTIMPGTTVLFDDYTQLRVYGTLLARGTHDNRIIFTASDISKYPENSYSGWRGIRFYGPNLESLTELAYCTIQYAKGTDNGSAYDKYGGGLYIEEGRGVKISNCIITKNSALERGGGLYSYDSNIKITNSIISNNTTGGSGGGLFLFGSPFYTNLYNNIICNNSAGNDGGGIYAQNINSINNHIVNNNAGSGSGGGLYVNYGDGHIYNTIVWGNSADHFPQLGTGYSGSSVYFHNSVLEDGLAYVTTIDAIKTYDGMLEQNPQFIMPGEGTGAGYNGQTADWSLLASSPCINAGTRNIDLFGYVEPDTDIKGESRIVMDSVDIGAYEFRNIAPVKAGEIPDQQVYTGSVSDITVPLEGIFVDPNAGDILSYSFNIIDPPAWLSIDIAADNIIISGTPALNDIGTIEAVLIATDLFDEEAADTFQIEVMEDKEETSITGFTDNQLKIFPVPADHILYIETEQENNTDYSVEIINTEGETIQVQDLNINRISSIDVSSVPSGLYHLKIKSENYCKIFKLVIL